MVVVPVMIDKKGSLLWFCTIGCTFLEDVKSGGTRWTVWCELTARHTTYGMHTGKSYRHKVDYCEHAMLLWYPWKAL